MEWPWMTAIALIMLSFSPLGALADGVTPEEARELRDEVRGMFYHAFDGQCPGLNHGQKFGLSYVPDAEEDRENEPIQEYVNVSPRRSIVIVSNPTSVYLSKSSGNNGDGPLDMLEKVPQKVDDGIDTANT